MRVVKRITFSTECREGVSVSPDELLTEWLNDPEQATKEAHLRGMPGYLDAAYWLKLLSVQQIDYSSRLDTPNTIEETATYLVTFSTND